VREDRDRLAVAVHLDVELDVAVPHLRHEVSPTSVDALSSRRPEDDVTEISVTPSGAEPTRFTFSVRLADRRSESMHEVTVSSDDLERLGARYRSPEEFIRACFEFLLQREGKEQILRTFDVSVIGTYFPDFERTIASQR
jgi:hypothetical protein